MGKIKDLTGQRFGKLVVISYAGRSKWNCLCDCGNTKTVYGPNLGKSTNSCGCLKREDLTGKRFGLLTAILVDSEYTGINTKWICKCDCGETVSVFRGALIQGKTKSCGCYNKKQTVLRQTKHGKCKSRQYNCWSLMKQRCTNKNFKEYDNYGGRGIKVCEEWKDNFQAFYDWAMSNGYADNLTLDRIDVNGDYCPENCRWSTYYQQARNRSCSIFIEYNGQRMIAKDWAKYLGISYGTILRRLKQGLPTEKVLAPTNRNKVKKENKLEYK